MGLDTFKSKLTSTFGDAAGIVKEVASEATERATDAIQKGSQIAIEKAQDAGEELRRSHYNPVFPDEYRDPEFDLPRMVIIADEDERKGIDVCEGACGWLSKHKGLEVLHLYDEFVDESGLRFLPFPSCDTAYYSHPFDRELFVNIASYMDVMQQDKLSELKNVAHKLGAKHCKLEAFEEEKTVRLGKLNASRGVRIPVEGTSAKVDETAEAEARTMSLRSRGILFDQTFEGSDNPVRPELKWFAHDSEIKSLIDMRCANSGNATKTYTVKIECKNSATMSVAAAEKIDAALGKLGAKANFSLKGEIQSESRQTMLLKLEF